MATARPCIAQFTRHLLSTGPRARLQIPSALCQPTFQHRFASDKKGAGQKLSPLQRQKKKKAEAPKKKRKQRNTYIQYDLKDAEQFSLCDAMRYIRAFEVGRSPTSVKYDLHLKLKSLKNGPVIRNRLRLPHPVKTDLRICVICPPNSPHAEAAKAAGAVLVGEDDIFEAVKDGRIDFDRCLCQTESLAKMNKAGLGRILGPRQLMPSAKMGTVIKDPAAAVRDMVGGAEYRERLGVVRMAIGQLGFTPEEMQKNIKAFMGAVKKDIAQLSDRISKEVAEVVLSSTNGPGFSLNGDFRSATSSVTPRELSTS